MAEVQYDLEADPRQTYEFENGVPDYVGHLLAFSVGDETLDVDIEVIDPEAPDQSSPIKVCSLLTQVSWNKLPGQTLMLYGRVSSPNRAKLLRSTIQAKQGTRVKFNFVWDQYNEPDNNYFKHFHTNGEEIEGEIDKNSPLWVATRPSSDITDFRNYDFSLGIKAVDTKTQVLHVAATPTDKDVLTFGKERKA